MPELFKIKEGPFSPAVESLKNYVCPDWFRDAKFGIWSHWGPQSVPMFGDWYARNMYLEGSPMYRYHWRKYGHPSVIGYKDIIKLWKAENFDPAELMDLYVEAGAKYFISLAVHHDNFDNFDSPCNPWNSVNVGPGRDICALWQAEARRHGLPFGVSEHLGASYTWFTASHGGDKTGPYAGVPYDGADPANRSLYRDNDSELLETSGNMNWYTQNPLYHVDWFSRIKSIIDKFQPDLLYSDGEIPFRDVGYAIVAHLYNTSCASHSGKNNAVYTFKQHIAKDTTDNLTRAGVLDIERGLAEEPLSQPWQCDTSLGDWFYNVNDVYKTADEIADTLIDIVSKNGNLLLNVPQKPDGTIDDETRYTLKKFGAWLKNNGDGIFGCKPYIQYREGKTELAGGSFKEGKAAWESTDYRFTQKDNVVFAYKMRAESDEKAFIHTLGRRHVKEIKSVEVSGRPAEFEQKDEALLVRIPGKLDKEMPVCISITVDK